MGRLGGESERGTERKKGLKRREEVLGVLLTSAPLVWKCFPTPCAGKKLVGGNEERGKSGALAVFLCRDYSNPPAPPSPLLTPMFRFRPNRNYVPSLVEFRVQTLPSKASNELNIACQRRTTLHRSSSIFHVWQYVANFKKSSRKNNLQKLLCPSYETFVNGGRIWYKDLRQQLTQFYWSVSETRSNRSTKRQLPVFLYIDHAQSRIAVNTRLNNFRSNRRINSFEERSPLISIDLRHSNPLSIIDPD